MSIAFLFPGQGSQQVGMGHKLYQRIPASQALFDQADEQLGFALTTLCFKGTEEELTDTENQQPALFVTSIAAWQAMIDQNWPSPAFVAGHSLGEFSALVAVGSLSFSDGLALVRRRGQLMKAAGEQDPGAMAAVLALDVPTVKEVCAQASKDVGQLVSLANDNCPGQVVISGHTDALTEAVRLAEEAGARKIVRLPISIAAHSTLMAWVAAEVARAVDATPIQTPEVPIVGNVTATPLTTPEEIRAELKAQLTSPVLWTDSINHLCQQGVDTFVEVGPGNVLLGLVKRINRQAKRVEFELD
jgi:[acyl-carrier-protein] S-malonyltransferase